MVSLSIGFTIERLTSSPNGTSIDHIFIELCLVETENKNITCKITRSTTTLTGNRPEEDEELCNSHDVARSGDVASLPSWPDRIKAARLLNMSILTHGIIR